MLQLHQIVFKKKPLTALNKNKKPIALLMDEFVFNIKLN